MKTPDLFANEAFVARGDSLITAISTLTVASMAVQGPFGTDGVDIPAELLYGAIETILGERERQFYYEKGRLPTSTRTEVGTKIIEAYYTGQALLMTAALAHQGFMTLVEQYAGSPVSVKTLENAPQQTITVDSRMKRFMGTDQPPRITGTLLPVVDNRNRLHVVAGTTGKDRAAAVHAVSRFGHPLVSIAIGEL